MELRQLEYFVAVAEEGQFTRAAQRLHIVQSGLSAAIRGLERELGATLFVRGSRQVTLTDSGRVLLAEARRTLEAAAAAREAVAAVQGLLRGTLSLGIGHASGRSFDVSTVVSRFHEAHPGVVLRIRHDVSAALLADVRAGALDLALSVLTGPAPAGVEVTPLWRDTLVLICGERHRLADSDEITLEALRDEAFVAFQGSAPAMPSVEAIFSANGLERRIACAVDSLPLLAALVCQGVGVAVTPRAVAQTFTGVRMVPIQVPNLRWQVVIATGPAGSVGHAAAEFRRMMVERANGLALGDEPARW